MKLLLVEDNPKLNEATKMYLEDNGFSVDTAFNGVQALSKVKDLQKTGSEYDVIILDRMMPMKDGIETMREIKNFGVNSGIIILTAKDTVDDKVFGLAAGADDYMVKPFNVKELIARIHSLYRRNLVNRNSNSQSRKDVNLEAKDSHKNNDDLDFTFDVNIGEIYLKNKNLTISLTGKESSIFKILLDNSPEPISKDFILERIWRESDAPSSRFVDVHVHNLRTKLIKNNFSGRIETERNAGYKLILN